MVFPYQIKILQSDLKWTLMLASDIIFLMVQESTLYHVTESGIVCDLNVMG